MVLQTFSLLLPVQYLVLLKQHAVHGILHAGPSHFVRATGGLLLFSFLKLLRLVLFPSSLDLSIFIFPIPLLGFSSLYLRLSSFFLSFIQFVCLFSSFFPFLLFTYFLRSSFSQNCFLAVGQMADAVFCVSKLNLSNILSYDPFIVILLVKMNK